MKKYLAVTFILNIMFITFAYGLLGLFICMVLAGGIYYLAQTALAEYKNLTTKLLFFMPHLLGIFAAHTVFQNNSMTLMIGMMEIVVFMIFSSFNY